MASRGPRFGARAAVADAGKLGGLQEQCVAADLAEINASTLHLLRHQPKLFDLTAKRALLTLMGWVQAVRGRDHLKKMLRECCEAKPDA